MNLANDLYEERVAIMTHDGGMSESDAEREAWKDVARQFAAMTEGQRGSVIAEMRRRMT